MSRKKKITIVILGVFVLIALLWWLGDTVKKNQEKENALYYSNLLAADSELQALVEKNLELKGLTADWSDFSPAEAPRIFTPSDLKLSDNLDEASVKQYGKEIGQILRLYQAPRNNEVFLALEALKNTDPRPLAEIKQIKSLHEEAVNKLAQISVPKNAQIVHLRLINSINRLANSLSQMNTILDDPSTGLESSEDYIRNYVLFFAAVESMNVYFSKQGIIFNENEIADIYDSIGIVGTEG